MRCDLISTDEDGDIADAVEVAPDATIEVLLPQQSSAKVIKNIKHCLNHATEVGWLIDPKEKVVIIFYPDNPLQILDQAGFILLLSAPIAALK
ncbi:MAG: Uma2 family endonuclease [Phormidesmis sp.]